MAQVWRCVEDLCGYATVDPKAAGDHERSYNDGELAPSSESPHFMDDLGE